MTFYTANVNGLVETLLVPSENFYGAQSTQNTCTIKRQIIHTTIKKKKNCHSINKKDHTSKRTATHCGTDQWDGRRIAECCFLLRATFTFHRTANEDVLESQNRTTKADAPLRAHTLAEKVLQGADEFCLAVRPCISTMSLQKAHLRTK